LGLLAAVACAAAALGACAEEERATVLAEPMALASEGGSQPTTATLPDGTVLTAWVGMDHNVWLRSSDASVPVRVNDVDGDAAPHAQAPAQVAAGPDGHVYVVWHNETPIEGRRFPASDLRFARSSDGGRTFERAITVNDDAAGPPTSHTFQDLLVTREGTVVVSWIDSRSREDEGPHHGAAGGHGGDAVTGGDPAAGGDAVVGGDPVAGGAATDPGPGRRGPEIRVARSTDGGRSFSASAVVSVDACPCCRTAMAAGPDGAIYLAWRHIFDGSVRDIVVARSDDGGVHFGTPRRVHEDGWVFDGCPHAGPSLAVTPDGVLHVAWYTGREGAAGLYRTTSSDRGETFGPARAVLTGDWVPPSTARLSAAEDGSVWLAWEDRRTDEPRIHLARVAAERAGAVEETDFPGTSPDMPPRVAGDAVLAFLGGGGDAVMATRSTRPPGGR
jgi:hypothetical protein